MADVLPNYQSTQAWKTAVALGKPLTLLTEELPAQEDHGLIMTLQGLMVDLPASIALDIIAGTSSTTRRLVLLKLQAAIEIVDTVYPALDTAGLKQSLQELMEHSESNDFGVIVEPEAPVSEVAIETTSSDQSSEETPAGDEASEAPVASTPDTAPIVAPAPTVVDGVTITDPSLTSSPQAPNTAASQPQTVAVTPDAGSTQVSV